MVKKQEAGKKDAGKSGAGTPAPEPDENQVPESDENQVPEPDEPGIDRVGPEEDQGAATPEIETVEELEIVYPKLVSAVRDEVIRQIGNCSLKQVKANMPDFYERLVREVQNKSGPNLNVPGFLLEVNDLFAEGTLQTYQRLKGLADLRLPYVLPYKDKVTRAALENYILRAEGSCDIKSAEIVRKAMEKCK